MRENTPPEFTLSYPADEQPEPIADRLDEIERLLQIPRDYFERYNRPNQSDFRESAEPVLDAIDLLVAEIREIRDRV
ncbi:hypothetical protein [Microbacterium galbinum]|uniref:hypothetical protein n=1 Tax=Microbacterium galbinum TaxID=2851646 RepID=UPI001FFCE09A|nr:hypothetical protein [Microbacterium galbinum]